MRISDFDPSVSYRVRLAAAYFGLEPSVYVRRLLEAELARLAEANDFLKAAFNIKD